MDILFDRHNDTINKRQKRISASTLYKRIGEYKLPIERRPREFYSGIKFSDLLRYFELFVFLTRRLQQNLREGGFNQSSENNRVDGFISS